MENCAIKHKAQIAQITNKAKILKIPQNTNKKIPLLAFVENSTEYFTQLSDFTH